MRHHEPLTSTPKTSLTGDDLGGIALFFDLENILLGVQGEFVVKKVVEFLAERGEVMILRAYADWGRYRREQRQFLEEGVQMVFLPSFGAGDKNRTDTAICVDAMEILFTRPHIDTFAIVSGDSDFGVLAQRLRDHAKRVVGISAKSAASQILVKQCHEFVFYETLVGQRVQGYSVEEGEARVRKALDKVVEELGVEFRASVLKDLMRKQDPTFSERNYGAASFTRFLHNYDHIVTLLDGGLVRVGSERVEDGGGDGAAKRKRPGLTPETEAKARELLARAIATAAAKRTPVRLSRLKDTLLNLDGDFDEGELGFRTFRHFLRAFPGVVTVDRENDMVTPAGAPKAAKPSDTPAPRAAEAPPEAPAPVPVEAAPSADPGPVAAPPAAPARGRGGRSRRGGKPNAGEAPPTPAAARGGRTVPAPAPTEAAPAAPEPAEAEPVAPAPALAPAAPAPEEAKAPDAPAKPAKRKAKPARAQAKPASEPAVEAAPAAAALAEGSGSSPEDAGASGRRSSGRGRGGRKRASAAEAAPPADAPDVAES